MRKQIFSFIFLLFLIYNVNCATYFVGMNGSGSNCTLESPCSIDYVNTLTFTFGDIIQIGCGNFRGLNVSEAIIRGDDTGCTTFNSSASNCMSVSGNITITGIKFVNCLNTIVNNRVLNLTLANSTFTSSPILLNNDITRVEMQNVSSDLGITLFDDKNSLYFYIFNTKSSFFNITSSFDIVGGSTINNLQVGKNANRDPLSITANKIGDETNPIIIKTLKVISANANALNINSASVSNIMLINSYIQSAKSRSIVAVSNQDQIIFSVRNTQFFSSGPLDFISNSNVTNKTTVTVKIDSSSFTYINTTSNVLNLRGNLVEFKTCSTSFTNIATSTNVISVEDTVANTFSSVKGFISNSVFSNCGGNYINFAKNTVDSKFLICGNSFVGGSSSKRALFVTSSTYRAAQNNNFYDDNFSSSVIEVVSKNIQLNFTSVIFNGTSPNFLTHSNLNSTVDLNFENSLINPRTYVATNCLNVDASSINLLLNATTFRNCDSIGLNSLSSSVQLVANSSIYTVGYYQTNIKCPASQSVALTTVLKNTTQICFNQLKLNNCFNANITQSSCSDSTFVSRFGTTFIQSCQKTACACHWQGDCSCNSTSPPSFTLQTAAYCSKGTYYIYDYYPLFLPSGTFTLQDSLNFYSAVWIKNTTKFVLNYNGTYSPLIYSRDFINVTGTLTINNTARPNDLDSKNPKKTLVVVESAKKISGKFLTITATTNYTVNKKCDTISLKSSNTSTQYILDFTYHLNVSCSSLLSDGAVIGIMIAIIIAIIVGVFVSHKIETCSKK